MPFLDPDKPLATCAAEDCDDCPVGERMCPRGFSFACPLNGVQGEIRQRFFERNPRVADA